MAKPKNFFDVQVDINRTMLKVVKNLGRRVEKLEKKGRKHVTK